MTDFYIRRGESTEGPFPEDELRRRCSSGELPLGTMSWREGEPRWISLGKRWGSRFAGLGSLLAGWSVALATLALALWIPFGLNQQLPAAMQSRAWVVALTVGAVCIAGLSAFLYWRAASRLKQGTVPIGAATCAVLTALMGTTAIAFAMLVGSIGDQRIQAPNGTVVFDPTLHQLRIDGPLGVRLTSDVTAATQDHPDIERVVINSTGGLITDAKAVGALLRDRNLPVRVQGQCASACVLIWAMSPSREMTLRSTIGIHQSRLDVNLPTEWASSAKQTVDDDSTSILKAAGFSDAVLSKQASTSPASMYWLNTADAMDAGVTLKTFNEQGQPISADEVRLRLALGLSNPSLQRLVDVLVKRTPSLVAEEAARLYAEAHANDSAGMLRDMGALMVAAKTYGLSHAPDEAVVAWASHLRQMMTKAVRANDATTCGYVARGGDAKGTLRNDVVDALVTNISELLEAVPDDLSRNADWPIPASYGGLFHDLATKVAAGKIARGYPPTVSAWSVFQICDFGQALYGGIVALPMHQAAQMVRVSEGIKTVNTGLDMDAEADLVPVASGVPDGAVPGAAPATNQTSNAPVPSSVLPAATTLPNPPSDASTQAVESPSTLQGGSTAIGPVASPNPDNQLAPQAAPVSPSGPSFDCSKATNPTALAICGNADLAALDRQMAALYFARFAIDPSERVRQRQWIQLRNGVCGTSVECLRSQFNQRIQQLQQAPQPAHN